jgi:hypothetical protein
VSERSPQRRYKMKKLMANCQVGVYEVQEFEEGVEAPQKTKIRFLRSFQYVVKMNSLLVK